MFPVPHTTTLLMPLPLPYSFFCISNCIMTINVSLTTSSRSVLDSALRYLVHQRFPIFFIFLTSYINLL